MRNKLIDLWNSFDEFLDKLFYLIIAALIIIGGAYCNYQYKKEIVKDAIEEMQTLKPKPK